MRRARWLDEARTEALDAAREYAEVDPALGIDLWDRIEHQLALVQRFPETGQLVAEVADVKLRRHFLDRFAYTLIVVVLPAELVVVAFHHQRRDPEYWKPRLARVRL